jgi:hypothetical protein
MGACWVQGSMCRAVMVRAGQQNRAGRLAPPHASDQQLLSWLPARSLRSLPTSHAVRSLCVCVCVCVCV